MSVTNVGSPSSPPPRPGRPDLVELLVRAAAGDVDAFARFYDLTIDVVYRYACAISPDRTAADALARGLYLRAWREAGEYAGSGLSPVAWLLAERPHERLSTAC